MFIDTLKLEHVSQLGCRPDCLYQEVLAANGKFRRAWRAGLEVLIPEDLNYRADFQGVHATPYVRLDQRVPLLLFRGAYGLFQQAMPREALAWFTWNDLSQEYSLVFPVQLANEGMVVPLDQYHPAMEQVLVEIHSHNSMRAFFSGKDDRDEQNGVRIFAVIGCLDKVPQIKVRVGVFGCWMAVKPDQVLELPEGIEEAV